MLLQELNMIGYILANTFFISCSIIIRMPAHVFLCAVPNTAIRISTSALNTPILGQNHSVHCVVSETVRGLSARPDLQWLDHDNNELIAGSQIILDGPSYQSTLATLTLTFNTLHTSHAGRYICWASLSSPPLSSPLVKTEDYNISIQSEFTPVFHLFSYLYYQNYNLTVSCFIYGLVYYFEHVF